MLTVLVYLYMAMATAYCLVSIKIDKVTYSLDDSGRWGKGGLFSALSSRSLEPQTAYELAGRMKDLSLGDAHVVPIDDLMSREQGSDSVGVV